MLVASYFLNKVTCTRKSCSGDMNLHEFCGIMSFYKSQDFDF